MCREARTAWLAAGVLLAALAQPAAADVAVQPPFGENMVLQCEMPAPVWGTADPGEQVTVSLGDQRQTTTADETGRWRVRLEPLRAGGPYEMTIRGKNTLRLDNVAVGEVWLCGGQSNMRMPMAKSLKDGWPISVLNAEQEIAQAHYPMIRLLTVDFRAAGEPQPSITGDWNVCSPKSAPTFSATAYFTGRDLHRALKVPVGLISSSHVTSLGQAWISRRALEADPAFRPMLDRWQKVLLQYEQARQEYKAQVRQWEALAREAEARGGSPPPRPEPPPDFRAAYQPAGLYNGMIWPLIPFAIRGVIWYQGESDVLHAAEYRRLFPALIRDWRQAWNQGDFPFLFVQLANFNAASPEASGPRSTWAELREAQMSALALPQTAMVVAIDIGESDSIHPRNKQEVGRRLALAALGIAYGEKVVYSGPLYDSRVVEGNKVRLRFRYVGSGLIAQGNDGLQGFTLAGEKRRFCPATAKIEGDTVVVWSDQVQRPMAVRYAWAEDPVCNLYNKDGLPASPFRTDQWPLDETPPPPPPKEVVPYGDLALLALVLVLLVGFLLSQLKRPRQSGNRAGWL